MVYLCKPLSNNVHIEEKELNDYKWCTLTDIQNMDIYPNLKQLLISILI